jgi:hypothetical protein
MMTHQFMSAMMGAMAVVALPACALVVAIAVLTYRKRGG